MTTLSEAQRSMAAMFPSIQLAPGIAREVHRIRQAWTFVGKAFQDANPACETCGYCRTHIELRPYGEGSVQESMVECRLGEGESDQPEQCPAYSAHLQELEAA